ncbi:MAG: phage tail sheath C-terminal domain-containing protein [Thermoleophilia bacterium]
MAEYLAPGVYVEEIPAGARPIEGVATSTAGFVGVTERGPAELTRVDGLAQYEQRFGGPTPGVSHLHDAIRGFFGNGGATAYVARVPDSGAAALIAGVDRVADADGIALLVVPDEAVAGPGVAAAMAARCERTADRVAVLSTPERPGPGGPPGPPDSPFAAAYHPWIAVADPAGGRRVVPPAGHVAGVIARTAREDGVGAAPAGVPLLDAIGPATRLSSRDTERLTAARINAIVMRGVPLVWGARTTSSGSEWRYLNVRRLVTFLERSIDEGTRWALFERDEEPLWARVRGAVEDFLHGCWRDGGLAGSTPGDAFFVRCDRSTMTQDDIDRGRLVCLVGVAPLRPAEFVIFRIGHWAAQPGLGAFPFLLAIDGVATAGFSAVTGLPGQDGAGGRIALRMTRGLTAGPELTGWVARSRRGDDDPRAGTVVLRDERGAPAGAWRLHRVRPHALAAAGRGPAGGEVVVDALELTGAVAPGGPGSPSPTA